MPGKPKSTATDTDIELLHPDAFDEFLLHTRAEILPILRNLRDSQALITLYFEHSGKSLLSAMLGVNDHGIALDCSREPALNNLAAQGGRMIAATALDKVKIQFPVGPLEPGEYQGQRAFAAPLPTKLLRLQRREYYRLAAPSVRPLRCRIPASLPNGSHKSVDASVVDIGGGGLAIMVPPEGVPFDAGMAFHNCRIDLPEVGIIVSDVRVRSTFEITAQAGIVLRRAGCQFVNLPGPMLTLIQRYIIRMERERKARATAAAA